MIIRIFFHGQSSRFQTGYISQRIRLVVQSPLTIGPQLEKPLCDLCAFAVNLILRENDFVRKRP